MALTKVTTGGIKDGTITNEDISTTTSISQDKLAATPGASSIASGLMIPADKNKLDGVADNANNYSHPSAHTVSEVTGLQGLLDGKTTETYVNTQITNVIGAAPAALDTLTELAAALGDDANYAATVTTALAGKVDDSQVLTNVPSGALFTDTNTTYSVGDGGLTQVNFTTADNTKLDGIEAGANVTDTTNVTAAGALMDSEVTNLTQVKAFDTTDYATAAQGTTADAALPKAGGTMTGAITTNSTFDGRDVSVDGAKLDGIEAGATADQTKADIDGLGIAASVVYGGDNGLYNVSSYGTYIERVFILLSLDNTNVANDQWVGGKFISHRYNGCCSHINFIWEGAVHKNYSSTGYSVRMHQYSNMPLCTFNYNGILYLGLRLDAGLPHGGSIYFTGHHRGSSFGQTLDYYDSRGTVLNTEIYNSIVNATGIVTV